MAKAKLAIPVLNHNPVPKTQSSKVLPNPSAGNRGSTKKPVRKPTTIHTLTSTKEIVNEVVLQGRECVAGGSGSNPIVVAVGKRCRASGSADTESYMACTVAVGVDCEAETHAGNATTVAVGIGATAISHEDGNDSVAIGYEPFAQAWGENGTAIAIGEDPSAQAEEGSYLIFIDTTETEPKVGIFKVDPDQGVWPNIPYWWRGGWSTPCPETERVDQEGFKRGREYPRERGDDKK
jgi:hypothetical protein